MNKNRFTAMTWIPYDTSDIEKNAGEKLAEELRASGKYSKVECRPRKPEGERQFVRIYVIRKDT